jgi:hypothetical protein
MKCRFLVAVTFMLCISGTALADGFIPILSPDAGYLGTTKYIDPSATPDFSFASSITDGIQTVSMDTPLLKVTFPYGWPYWSSSPNSQFGSYDSFPVLFTSGNNSLTMTFSTAVTSFGFEAEPDFIGIHDLTATFYDGANPIGTITQGVDGYDGASLFAGSTTTDEFTSVKLTSDSTDGFQSDPGDFAIAAVRYTPVPEPSSLILAGTGMLAWAGFWRRKATTLVCKSS